MSDADWWRRGVIYNAYPRSFQDTNGDGVGDLRGIIARLDYLAWLGITGLWLNPITPSPNRDWGYDVSDYFTVHADLGTIEDLDQLIVEARQRGIRIILDVVPSHTSDQHPWFEDARSSRDSRYRDYYVWNPGTADGSPPTNWCSYFGGPAWTRDQRTGDFYLHNYSPHQPQLNWWNPKVVTEFDRIYRFWLDRGVAGLRIDSLQTLFYDHELRNNPPAEPDDSRREQRLGQRFTFNSNRPEVHDVIRRWRVLADSYPEPRVLFGETWVQTIEQLMAYYGDGQNELDMAWNPPFLTSAFHADDLRAVIGQTLRGLPAGATPTWAMSTHDGEGRAASRWCHGNDAAIRCALFILLTLEGTPVLYYGDEIGMIDLSPRSLGDHPRDYAEARDASRSPMQWEDAPGGGFTTASRPWLPVGDTTRTNVADQREDPESVLRLCRELMRIRAEFPPQRMILLPAAGDLLAWRRGDYTIAINVGYDKVLLPAPGTVVLGTDRARIGERVVGALVLDPFEGIITRMNQAQSTFAS